MVIEISNKVATENLKDSLEGFRENKSKRNKPNLTEFFGVLPNIGDGLVYQKKARNEWN